VLGENQKKKKKKKKRAKAIAGEGLSSLRCGGVGEPPEI